MNTDRSLAILPILSTIFVLIGFGGGFALFDAGLAPIAFVLVAVIVAAVMGAPGWADFG